MNAILIAGPELSPLSAAALVLFLKSTAVAGIGLVLWFVFRHTAAATRHLILLSTLAAMTLLPAMTVLLPGISVPVIAVSQSQQSGAAPVTEFSSYQAAPIQSLTSAVTTDDTLVSTPLARDIQLEKLSIAFYSLGAATLLFYLLVGLLRVWWLDRRAHPTTQNSDWQKLLSTLTSTRMSQRLTLKLSAHLNAPLTWGIRKPAILLPQAADQWPIEEKRNALLHELAHVQRCDWMVQILSRIACAIHWINPLAWIAFHKMVQEAEIVADNNVLHAGVAPDSYAQQLVRLSSNARTNDAPLAATTMASKTFIYKRLKSILTAGESQMPLSTRKNTFIATLILVSSGIVAATQPVAVAKERTANNFTAVTDDVSTPLIRAAVRGDADIVAALISEGVDVNAIAGNRGQFKSLPRTALVAAAKAGHIDIVQQLIDAGAPVDRIVRGDASALIEASQTGNFELAQYLLSVGADANLAVHGDGSPLIGAAKASSPDLVRLLLANGADPNLSVSGDENPLFHAAANGNEEIIELLIEAEVDVDQEWPGDGTALIIASRSGNVEAVDALIDAGARADQGIRGDGNALIAAAERGDSAMLQKMIATGADVNASIKGDGSPLIAAARNGHMEATALLLQAGADINQVVPGDENALIGASWKGDIEMVDYLLRSGADPTIVATSYGETRTAISQAEREGHEDVVRMLRAAGATK